MPTVNGASLRAQLDDCRTAAPRKADSVPRKSMP